MSIKSQLVFFARQFYATRANQLSPQRLINVYAETVPQDVKGENRLTLYGIAGKKTWVALPTGAKIQGMQVMGENLYAISGNDVYKITSNKTVSLLGSVSGGTERVSLSNNGTQLTIVESNGNGYVATSSTLTQITDPDFPSAGYTTFIDGYTVVTKANTDQYNISSLNDSTTWGGTDFATAESEPDKLVGVEKFKNQLWLFGTDTIEIHSNTGNPDFPFERINGATMDKGCGAKFSIAQDENVIIWLGNDKVFYVAQGYGMQKISTYPIDSTVLGFDTVDDAFAGIYTQNGHKFYEVTFPTAGKTFVYDIYERLWHERESTASTGFSGRSRTNATAFFAGKNLVGDFESGTIYELDNDTYTDAGQPLIRTTIGKIIFSNKNRFIIHKFELDMETGVGLISGQGVNPQIMLQVSRDGGRTYGAELWRTLGAMGEYTTRVLWRRLGIAREMNFKVKVSDPVQVAIFGAYIDYEQLQP